jgi:hypothetical protein
LADQDEEALDENTAGDEEEEGAGERGRLVVLPHTPLWAPVVEGDGAWLLLPEVLQQALAALAQQLAEKLDSLRQVAGRGLVRLLGCDPLRALLPPAQTHFLLASLARATSCEPSDPPEEVLRRARQLNWARPDVSFPLAARLLHCPGPEELFRALLGGLAGSGGALTESTGREALQALLAELGRDGLSERRLLCELLGLLRAGARIDRVVLPLLRALELLLRNGTWDSLRDERDGMDLLAALLSEARGCKAVSKLLLLADLQALLLAFTPCRPEAFRALLSLLAHAYPRVRKCECLPSLPFPPLSRVP